MVACGRGFVSDLGDALGNEPEDLDLEALVREEVPVMGDVLLMDEDDLDLIKPSDLTTPPDVLRE